MEIRPAIDLADAIRDLPERICEQAHAIEAAAAIGFVLGLIVGLLLRRHST